MSPIAGVGINVAIQDAVEAANLLWRPLRTDTLSVRDLKRVQVRRELSVRLMQAFQAALQNRVVMKTLAWQRHGRSSAPVPMDVPHANPARHPTPPDRLRHPPPTRAHTAARRPTRAGVEPRRVSWLTPTSLAHHRLLQTLPLHAVIAPGTRPGATTYTADQRCATKVFRYAARGGRTSRSRPTPCRSAACRRGRRPNRTPRSTVGACGHAEVLEMHRFDRDVAGHPLELEGLDDALGPDDLAHSPRKPYSARLGRARRSARRRPGRKSISQCGSVDGSLDPTSGRRCSGVLSA